MKDEIKEILDKIKYIVDNPTYQDVYYKGVNRCVEENSNYTALDSNESKLLLDYILDLNEKYISILSDCVKLREQKIDLMKQLLKD